jgi:anionic cell wall polymer biosynthesis LytR-Cps2A-Psr (LCP) family protein
VRSPLRAVRALSGRIVIAIVVCALVAGAAVFRINSYIDDRIDEIPRVQLNVAPRSGSAANFLIIGSDTRSFVANEQDKEAFTDNEVTADGPARSDTMMVLHADGDASYVVSFPRDLWVDVPGHGSERINAAFNDGPQTVIDTLQQDFNVPINHYLEVNFKS